MRKILQISVLLLATNLIIPRVTAQLVKLPKFLAFGNATYASPTGDFKNVSNYGVGYEVGGGFGLGKTLLMASIGNIRYNLPSSGHMNATPIKFGIRRYLLLGLFLNGNIGTVKQTYHTSAPFDKSSFLYEAGAGYKLGFIELGAAYTGYGSNNALLLKAGLAIKI